MMTIISTTADEGRRNRRPPAEHSTPWGVFGVASIAVFLVSINTTVLFAAFGALRAGFPGSTAADLSWVLNAYTVVYAALLVPAGRLVDAQGRKRIFQLGLVLFLVASAACGAAANVGMLVAARVLQAVGAALLTPSSLALVLGAFPIERRAVAVSLWGAVGGLAAALGPSVGAGIVDALGWRWAFFINLPLGLLAWWRGRRRLTEWRSVDHAASLDVPGIVLADRRSRRTGVRPRAIGGARWRSLTVLGSMASGLVVLLIFVGWARRAAHPAVDLSLFADRTYRYVNAASLAFGIAFAMMFFGLFFFLMEVWHGSPPKAGLAVTPGPLLVVPVAIIAGRVAARVGHRPVLVAGGLLYAAGGLAAVRDVLAKAGRIDLLVNNAGVGLVGGAEESSLEQAKSHFDVNLFGMIRTTKAVLPAMRRQRAGRIVDVSSVLGLIPAPYLALYSASKHALEGYSESLDHEIGGTEVRVVLVEPAYTRTSFEGNLSRETSGSTTISPHERTQRRSCGTG